MQKPGVAAETNFRTRGYEMKESYLASDLRETWILEKTTAGVDIKIWYGEIWPKPRIEETLIKYSRGPFALL